METGRQKAAVALIGMGLVVAGGFASYCHERASMAQAQLVKARSDITDLRRKMRLQQPNAPDVVLDYRVDAPAPAAVPAEGRVEVTAPAELPGADDRVRELEAALQAKERQLAALQERATNRPAISFQRRDPQAWVEDFKTRDPEGYKEFQKRREEQRKHVSDVFARQAEQLTSGDVQDVTEAQQAERQAMLTLVNETWQLAEKLYAEPDSVDRWTAMRAMHENLDTLRPMLATERARVFRQLGLESGYTEEDAQVFVEYLNEVIDATSVDPLRRAMRRGGRGGPRGPGGPPPNSSMPTAGTPPGR